MTMTALHSIMHRDGAEYQARRFANVLLNMMQDFIPRGCQRDAAELLYKTALDQGFELTSKQMREQYEAWMKISIDPQFMPVSFGENPGTTLAQKD